MIQAICLERQHKLQVIYAPTGTVTPHLPQVKNRRGFISQIPTINQAS